MCKDGALYWVAYSKNADHRRPIYRPAMTSAVKAMRVDTRGNLRALRGQQVYEPGGRYTLDLSKGPLKVGTRGFHACREAEDCLRPEYGYVPSDVLVHVQLRGALLEEDGKLCGEDMLVGLPLTSDQRVGALHPRGPDTVPGQGRLWAVLGLIPHREQDLPALEAGDGTRVWFWDGQVHRDGGRGPAIECADGTRAWCQYGVLHPDPKEGPAVVVDDHVSPPLALWFWKGRQLVAHGDADGDGLPQASQAAVNRVLHALAAYVSVAGRGQTTPLTSAKS